MSQRRNQKNIKKGGAGSSGSFPQLQTLSEMFPDWESEDLASLLSEHRNDVEIVIDLIVNNKVSKWESTKKEVRHKRREDVSKNLEQQSLTASNSQNTHITSSGEHRGKFTKDRHAKTERRREKKSQQGAKKDSTHSVSSANSAPASSAGATSSVPTTSVPSTSTSTASFTVPFNSWAAALAKDSIKSKSKSATKSAEELEAIVPESMVSGLDVATEQAQVPGETTAALQPKTQSSNVQPSTSWASAIKPKAKLAPKKISESEPEPVQPVSSEPEVTQEEPQVLAHEESNFAHKEELIEQYIVETTEEREKQPEPEQVVVQEIESGVVLPQHVSNVGISFGSLSVEDKQSETASTEAQKSEKAEGISFGTQQHEVASAHQSEDSQQTQHHQGPIEQKTVQEQQQSQQQSQQDAQQQSFQQQYEQQRKATSSQGYDYYSQFQQTQQPFPQQAAAGSIPAQFAYPSFDYSAYNQANQAGLGSVGSPGYYQGNIANNNAKSANSNPNSTGAADIAQSPLVANAAHHGLQNPQQSQQVPGGAPFGYPNYYNYYYNTPFYGNAAGMGANNSAYGFQQAQQQPQQQQSAEPSAPESDSNSGQSATQGAQAINQFYGAQYYGNPNQFGSRGGYPYNGYPSSQPYPQAGQIGEQAETQQNGQQQGAQQQSAPGPSGTPQYHQQMPQYAAYQQYPQYGTYQDNSQYRGWY